MSIFAKNKKLNYICKQYKPIKTILMAKKQEQKPQLHPDYRRYRVQFDITYKGDKGIKIEGASETMPDMHMTVRQLLENHSRGINTETHERQPLYFDTEIPTMKDITDIKDYKDFLQDKLKDVNKFLKEEKEKQDEINTRKAEEERQTKMDFNNNENPKDGLQNNQTPKV